MKTWENLKKNPDLWKRYFIREQVLAAIRLFFQDRKFHEVETPCLTGSLPPESYLDIFETTIRSGNHKSSKVYLPTSPEPFLKKLLVAGIGNCFAITKSFRNSEDNSLTHTPEFTILEWYRVEANYLDIMRDCEDLVRFIFDYLRKTNKSAASNLVYQGNQINLVQPWERISVSQSFNKYAAVDLEKALNLHDLTPIAIKKGYRVGSNDTWEMVFNQIFLNEIEPNLGKEKPTIIYDYPVQLAALSKKSDQDPRFAERFEFYIAGLELGDAYTELTDWKEQLNRFENEQLKLKDLGKTLHPTDLDFIEALKHGMPRSGGIAVGVDRLIMLFSDVKDISDTLFFPPKDLFY
jgi:elongation factor P--(R)-beta-lysine ligase